MSSSVNQSFVPVLACQWLGLHMAPQSTVISCGYLLAMMGMPGMFAFILQHIHTLLFLSVYNINGYFPHV